MESWSAKCLRKKTYDIKNKGNYTSSELKKNIKILKKLAKENNAKIKKMMKILYSIKKDIKTLKKKRINGTNLQLDKKVPVFKYKSKQPRAVTV